MSPDYRQIVADSLKEFREITKRQGEDRKRLVQLNKALRGLAPLLPPNDRDELLAELKASRKPPGLTETISNLLRGLEGDQLSANEIREQIENDGFDMSAYAQPSAIIFNTLKRLKTGGMVKDRLTMGADKKAVLQWKWIGD